MVIAHVPAAVLRSVLSIPAPRPAPQCGCAGCAETRHLEVERRTWRDLDDARRTADELRAEAAR